MRMNKIKRRKKVLCVVILVTKVVFCVVANVVPRLYLYVINIVCGLNSFAVVINVDLAVISLSKSCLVISGFIVNVIVKVGNTVSCVTVVINFDLAVISFF